MVRPERSRNEPVRYGSVHKDRKKIDKTAGRKQKETNGSQYVERQLNNKELNNGQHLEIEEEDKGSPSKQLVDEVNNQIPMGIMGELPLDQQIAQDEQAIGFGGEGEHGFSNWVDCVPANADKFCGYGSSYAESIERRGFKDKYYDMVQNPHHHNRLSFQRGVECPIISVLGKGSFATVYEVVNNRGVPFAAKVLNEGQHRSFADESKAFRRINDAPHPNLLRMISHETLHNGQEVFITRFMGPSLSKIMLAATQHCQYIASFPLMSIKNIGRQIALAMNHLESLSVFHLDLKPANIMLVRGDYQIAWPKPRRPDIVLMQEDIVVGDFGTSRFDTMEFDHGYLNQTPDYRAPEIFFGVGFTISTDVWSFAATLAELYTGTMLFKVNNSNSPTFELTTKDFVVEHQAEQDLFEAMVEIVGVPLPPMLLATLDREDSRVNIERLQDMETLRYCSGLKLGKKEDSEDYTRFYNLLKSMFIFDNRERPSFKEVLSDPFFN